MREAAEFLVDHRKGARDVCFDRHVALDRGGALPAAFTALTTSLRGLIVTQIVDRAS